MVFVENLGTTMASVNYVICATGLLITRNFRHSAASITMLLCRSTKNQPFAFRQVSRDFAPLIRGRLLCGDMPRLGLSHEPEHAGQRADGEQPQRVPWLAQDQDHGE